MLLYWASAGTLSGRHSAAARHVGRRCVWEPQRAGDTARGRYCARETYRVGDRRDGARRAAYIVVVAGSHWTGRSSLIAQLVARTCSRLPHDDESGASSRFLLSAERLGWDGQSIQQSNLRGARISTRSSRLECTCRWCPTPHVSARDGTSFFFSFAVFCSPPFHFKYKMPKTAGDKKYAKRPQSAYIFFSNAEREAVKKDKPSAYCIGASVLVLRGRGFVVSASHHALISPPSPLSLLFTRFSGSVRRHCSAGREGHHDGAGRALAEAERRPEEEVRRDGRGRQGPLPACTLLLRSCCSSPSRLPPPSPCSTVAHYEALRPHFERARSCFSLVQELAQYGPAPKKEKKGKAAAGGAGEAKGKGKKAAGAKSGVKPALSAYIFFCNATRAGLKAKHPEMSTAELTAKLGQEWKKLTPGEKKPYEDLAAKDKARVQAAKA